MASSNRRSADDDDIQDEFDETFGRLRTVVTAVVRCAIVVLGTMVTVGMAKTFVMAVKR